MKKLDIYIIKNFLVSFITLTSLFSLITIVFDISEKIDDFISSEATVSMIILEYYVSFVPYIAMMLGPLFIFLTVVFLTSRMAMRTEIVAILSSGISYYRFIRPYMIATTFLAFLVYGAYHYVLPMANKQRLEFENTYLRNAYRNYDKNIHMKLDNGDYVYLEHYNTKDSICYKFSIEHFVEGNLLFKLRANRAVWNPKNKSWGLSNYFIREIDGDDERIRTGVFKDTTLALSPQDFGRKDDALENLTTPELEKYIEKEKKRGSPLIKQYEVKLYERTAKTVSIFVLVIIGICLSSRKTRGGTGLHIAFSIFLAVSYMFIEKVTTTYAINTGLAPIYGVWTPVVLYTIIAGYLLKKAPK